jgi:hypothetical protein
MVELSIFCPGYKGGPLGAREHEDRSTTPVLGVPDADAISRQPAYFDTAAVHTAERALLPEGSANIGGGDVV